MQSRNPRSPLQSPGSVSALVPVPLFELVRLVGCGMYGQIGKASYTEVTDVAIVDVTSPLGDPL